MQTETADSVLGVLTHGWPVGRCENIGKQHTFGGRPTVVAPLIYEKKEILLVRNVRGRNWIFPQGGFTESDKILNNTARREIVEELGVHESSLAGYEVMLGHCVNDQTQKHLLVMAVPLRCKVDIVLNAENDACEWVRSYEQFQHLVEPTAHEHPIKYKLMCDAINMMYAQKLLRWSCTQKYAH